MSHDATANAYLRTKVLTAKPEELRLMLLDGAIKFLLQAREGVQKKDYEQSFNGFTKCRDIVLELINSMRTDLDADLCRRVGSVYTFIYSQLVEASLERDLAKAAKVLELLEYERETWVLLMRQIADERGGGTGQGVEVGGEARTHRTLSVQG